MRTHAWGTQAEMFGPRHEHRLAMFLRETARLPRNSLLLDAAVGLGQLAARLARQGHRVIGVDASFDAALHARRRNAIPSVVGDLTRLPFRDGVFDGATSGETLEHLDDDRSAVREIARSIRSGGRVIVTVPALPALWTASDDYYEHRRRYRRDELVEIFRSHGFELRRAAYWGFPVVLVYDYLFLLPMNVRRAKREVAADPALRSVVGAGRRRWLVGLVRAFFALDRLFSWVPFGPGLLLVAEIGPLNERTWREQKNGPILGK